MFRTTMLTTAATTILAALLLTACGTPDTTTRPAPAAAAPAAADTDKQELTRQAFGLTWGAVSETERTNLCDSLILLGPDRAAEEMGSGAAGSSDLDWDLMVELLIAKCDNR
ncbi:hypothetical protein OG596_26425 [Streptomyces sp. NBC_01102]|uniref:hypothetical protein n=1 Tax=Streptomyces sp. NBC_01102 TaxID=2903749 RepID=UPI003865083E|nr:hypothetical protein OG596_26425 [Streptomyces sp. NBC_01102]